MVWTAPKPQHDAEQPRPIITLELGREWWIPARLVIRQGDKCVEIHLPNWAAEALQKRLGNIGTFA